METCTKPFKSERHTFNLNVAPGYLFMPNKVSEKFTEAVEINPGDIVFDIGSGVGPLAVWAALEPSSEVYAVEIVKAQYELLKQNLIANGVHKKVHAYHGSFFSPMPSGKKADVIIADVSGIAEGPARALGWYPEEIPTGGKDGTGVIVPLLKQAGAYLASGGRLYFPVAVDLSDSEKIMKVANSNFASLEERVSVDFPLTSEQVEAMAPFLELPYINLRSRNTRKLWRGKIYEASQPR